MEIKVTKLTDEALLRKACSYTINAESKAILGKMYKCEHSPIRTQLFVVEMIDIPTFVSVHLVRHHVGIDHFVKSNREDRPGYSGDSGRLQPVNHMMLVNAQALINLARKRLCFQAHRETVKVMQAIKTEVAKVDQDLANRLVPDCLYRNGCNELKSCGYFARVGVDIQVTDRTRGIPTDD